MFHLPPAVPNLFRDPPPRVCFSVIPPSLIPDPSPASISLFYLFYRQHAGGGLPAVRHAFTFHIEDGIFLRPSVQIQGKTAGGRFFQIRPGGEVGRTRPSMPSPRWTEPAGGHSHGGAGWAGQTRTLCDVSATRSEGGRVTRNLVSAGSTFTVLFCRFNGFVGRVRLDLLAQPLMQGQGVLMSFFTSY